MLRAFAIGLTLLAGLVPAMAQQYPSRPINLVIPFPPGGNTDLMGRALQEALRKTLNQTVVAVNKGGASGTLGIMDIVRNEPDGYTMALTPNNPVTAQPHIQKPVWSMGSFRYICLTYYAPYVLMAAPNAPFKNAQEMIAFAKAKPQNLVYGHPGPGSQPHLGMLAVLGALGVDGLGVPFQGAGPMAQAMLSDVVMAIVETPAVAQASNLKILAAVSEERIPSLPDVPTLKELGYPAVGFTAGGLIVHKDTPAPVVATLEKACADATANAEYKAMVERLNATPRYMPGEEFRKLFEADSARNLEALQKAGLAK
ncbi:tripartite tricarboxylate transporter family receptor [Variibacter gotjawalensis]|uniref:Tripartite tricarboxylate transporter family receptor n=1 Tax=Variibacter gotjawalensis TaxID=1333996 RepID=A0A0S3PQF0_9BRAD|nr:tripartite tricarboxylate transporter substrate binding protein [Variibacter gotjawalensis]NIK48415.1 tripartite-type tricarboxylate transporter receptor subunit TctC [Variibacter gotjawalensis]RZS50282.1 tripartite-type tricarboxylate transporter receptor subunit TctC [Variibacter gotjawalensis]BAT58115.1 tripartite tricarboxylate transporter family receptor [Variibacter gotjawalensis]